MRILTAVLPPPRLQEETLTISNQADRTRFPSGTSFGSYHLSCFPTNPLAAETKCFEPPATPANPLAEPATNCNSFVSLGDCDFG